MVKLHPLAVRNNSECIQRKYDETKKTFPAIHSQDERSPFQHDKDRILYSKSFRRLMHKTQVCFTGTMNEHIRTRLTHTLEVAQIARAIARMVGVNEDLTEAIALGHDVGHTPFGHVGEYVINELLTGQDERKILSKFNIDSKKIKIGFKHNYQSVRVLMEVEDGYSTFKGLNLSYPVLEGILKHSKLHFKNDRECIRYETITHLPELYFNQSFSASIEGQIVSLSDEIAQVCHDIEDAIVGDYKVKKLILGLIDDLINQGIMKGIEDQPFMKKTDSPSSKINTYNFKEFISWIISLIVLESIDKIKTNMENYYKYQEKSIYPLPDYYPITKDIASETILQENVIFNKLKDIQERFIINNYKIHRENGKAKFILRQIIKAYLTNPKQLSDNVLKRYTKVCEIETVTDYLNKITLKRKTIRYLNDREFEECRQKIISDPKFLRILSDYIASMTDIFAFSEYKKLYLEEDTGL